MPSQRLGLFGGTFDPPHLGHLIVAQDVLECLALDRLLFVPAGLPPHKRNETLTAAPLRLAMVRAALDRSPWMGVSEEEMDREGPSYTVDTLRRFRTLYPGAELHFLMGADQVAGFHTWKEPETLASLARLVAMAREGVDPEELAPRVPVPFLRISVTRVDISSTRLRERVRAGLSVRYLVPEAVREIIGANRLYRDPREPCRSS